MRWIWHSSPHERQRPRSASWVYWLPCWQSPALSAWPPSVSKRMKEFGIRVALGAARVELIRAALGRPLLLLLSGSIAGLALGMLASRLLAQIVYEATPRDPLVLGGTILTMALLGLLATWIPARRSISIDPARLLRED